MLWAQLSFWVTFLLGEREGHFDPTSWGFDLSQSSRTSLCYRGQDQEVGRWLGLGPPPLVSADGGRAPEGRAWTGPRPELDRGCELEEGREEGREGGREGGRGKSVRQAGAVETPPEALAKEARQSPWGGGPSEDAACLWVASPICMCVLQARLGLPVPGMEEGPRGPAECLWAW